MLLSQMRGVENLIPKPTNGYLLDTVKIQRRIGYLAIAITRKYLKEEGFLEDREDEQIEDQEDIEDQGRNSTTRDSVFDRQTGPEP